MGVVWRNCDRVNVRRRINKPRVVRFASLDGGGMMTRSADSAALTGAKRPKEPNPTVVYGLDFEHFQSADGSIPRSARRSTDEPDAPSGSPTA
jgi:hypothetical protein